MADLQATANCLSGTFVAYITQQAAQLTEKMASIAASFVDPIQDLVDTNVSQIVSDVSTLTSGNVAGKLASMGSAILVNKMKRELNELLADFINDNPDIADTIARISNVAEGVYGIISLAVMLRKEAPYSAAKYLVDDIKSLLDNKETNLNQLKQHLIQLNNTIQSITDNPTETAQTLKDDLGEVVDLLGEAARSLLSLETDLSQTPAVFTEKYYDQTETKLYSAQNKLTPQTDVNILDVGYALVEGAVGTEFLTNAQLKVSSYAATPITYMAECELSSIERQTNRIAFFLERLHEVEPNYQAAVESTAMKSFRLSLVSKLRYRIQTLQSDIEEGLSENSLGSLGIHSMAWAGRLSSIIEMTPKIQDKIESAIDTEQQDRIKQMSEEIDAMLEAIGEVNTTHTAAGFEDLTALKSQVTTAIQQGRTILKLMDSSKIDNFALESFKQTISSVTRGGESAIQDSLTAVVELRQALDLFKTEPPLSQRLEQLLDLLELMGFDRAKDLLKIGKFKDFLDTTMDDASYLGLAIKCLISAERTVTDSVTLGIITTIREELESQRISELSAAFDIIDSGKSAAIKEIKQHLEEGQDNLKKVQRIIDEIQRIGEKAGQTIEAIGDAYDGVEQALGQALTSAGGDLNEVMSDLDVAGLQSGCMGQLKF